MPQDSLLIGLFLGQVSGGPPGLLDFLTVRDLVQLTCLNKAIRRELLKGIEYTKCPDSEGKEYIVPYPGFPGLFQTNDASGLFPHQLASLAAMHKMENPSDKSFGVLRGGILGDAPGLGKTITVLALIASTAGTRPVLKESILNDANAARRQEQAIADGWAGLRMNSAFNVDLNKVLRGIRQWGERQYGSKEKRDTVSDLIRHVQLPFPPNKFLTHLDFRRHVLATLAPLGVPSAELELFKWKYDQFVKEALDKSKRSYYKSKSDRRFLLEQSLIPSSATLIVVPDALMEHWCEQIRTHVLLDYFVDGSYNSNTSSDSQDDSKQIPPGIVYLDGIGDICETDAQVRNVNLNRPMESAPLLSSYMIVVTTFSRCQQEFRREQLAGRFKSLHDSSREPSNKRIRLARVANGDAGGAAVAATTLEPQSPLLQVRWLRLMMDEGHTLGAHDASSQGLTQIIHEIAAERRWVLSGTPTTGNQDDVGYTEECLDQLQRLFCFLRHAEYGSVPANAGESADLDQEVDDKHDLAFQNWKRNVKTPFLHRKQDGREELLRVLKQVTVMHQKEDINLPLPVFVQGEVTAQIPNHVQKRIQAAHSVSEARERLDKYMRTNEYQSMVDEAQGNYIAREIKQAMDRQRHLPPNASTADRRPIKAVVYSTSNSNLLSVAEYLYRQFHEENIAETSRSASVSMRELSRFRHGVRNVAKCPICGDLSDVDSASMNIPRCSRTLMEVRDANGQERFLIEPERIVGSVLRSGANSEFMLADAYRQNRRSWRLGDEFQVDTRDPHPLLARRYDAETWEEWGSSKCQELASLDSHVGSDWFFGPLPRSDDGTMTVKLEKFQQCSRFHNPYRWYRGPSLADAPVDVKHEDVFILCLFSNLSHGLDLSFVTHIYLLEPIEDAATLEQVTSRANRLGATGPVTMQTVNVWRDVSDETRRALGEESSTSRNTDTAVCEYCFRSFESFAIAEEHEATCSRNKNSRIERDPFDMASLYREIRPPPALSPIRN